MILKEACQVSVTLLAGILKGLSFIGTRSHKDLPQIPCAALIPLSAAFRGRVVVTARC